MLEFDDLWRSIVQRSQSFPTVQEYHELKHVFDLMQGCESYLEVGSAEGNSLYVLSHALKPNGHITYIDWDEKHTRPHREEVVKEIAARGISVIYVHGDSNDLSSKETIKDYKYDVVLIDAGHEQHNVMVDALLYGALATKYIIFHDMQIPATRKAYDWYCRQRPDCKNYTFIKSEHFGYGIMEIK